jgi:MoaA/NifB/PqqE/SkfB family radical SAM enzyme
MINKLLLNKIRRILIRKGDALCGRLFSLDKTLQKMASRPFELHLELTNLCNANCIFCPYQFQEREVQFMTDEVFYKAVGDFVSCGGGSVGLTPIVGDALIDKQFLNRVKYLRAQTQVDRVWLTTNAILLDTHGIDDVLTSGLSSINISIAGFDEAMYERVYRSKSYKRVLRNVRALLEKNTAKPKKLPITISLRPDRPLDEVMKYPDFQDILQFKPYLDFTWSYTTANGRITRAMLPPAMKLRALEKKKEPCVQLYNGPIVLPDGTVMACSCVAAIDAQKDLGIGNILAADLLTLWTSQKLNDLRTSFRRGSVNPTCSGCDMYRDLELYRTSEGRKRGELNTKRLHGEIIQRKEQPKGGWEGG